MRAWLTLLVACSAPAKQPPAAPTPAEAETKRDLAVAEPVKKEPAKPEREWDPNNPTWILQSADRRPPMVIRVPERRVPQQSELDVAEYEKWSPCVRDFVTSYPVDVRRALTGAFARYVVACGTEKKIVVAPPREYRGKPYVAFAGTLSKDKIDVRFEAATCGDQLSDVLGIQYEGKGWSTMHTGKEARGACTIVFTFDGKFLRRALRDALDAKELVVHFDTEDVTISDEMKRDLRLMLDALDALSAPP